MPAVIAGQCDVDGYGGQLVLLEGVHDPPLGVLQRVGETASAADGEIDRQIINGIATVGVGDRRIAGGGDFGNALDGAWLDGHFAALVGGEVEGAAGQIRARQLLEGEITEHEKGEYARPSDDPAGDGA